MTRSLSVAQSRAPLKAESDTGTHISMAAKNVTPPSTPTSRRSLELRSADADLLLSPSSTKDSRPSTEVLPRSPQVSSVKVFDISSSTYNLENAQIVGSGLWSTVYITESYPSVGNPIADLTPPSTPQRLSFDSAVAKPRIIAVKVPARSDAKSVLMAEAHILSYIAADPSSEAYVVQFHGLDERNGAIIMDAIPRTLDTFIEELEKPNEDVRKARMACLFPCVARRLVEGLGWLHSKGIVHGDIKPSNILIGRRLSQSPTDIVETTRVDPDTKDIAPLYCDFSASLRTSEGNDAAMSSSPPSKVAGGGTWEYLAPELLTLGSPDPTPASDVYALGITLLTFLMGISPFASMRANRFMLRHAIKSGEPLRFAHDAELKKVARLERWEGWVRSALAKKPEARPTAKEWLTQLPE
ncbi:MAG: hypothetical protein Q9165_006359 [Trypethelium subeluteriae]